MTDKEFLFVIHAASVLMDGRCRTAKAYKRMLKIIARLDKKKELTPRGVVP